MEYFLKNYFLLLEDAEADVNGVTDAMEKQSITEAQGEGKSYHIWNVMFNYLCNQKLVVYMHISSALSTRIVPYAQNEVILNCQKSMFPKYLHSEYCFSPRKYRPPVWFVTVFGNVF